MGDVQLLADGHDVTATVRYRKGLALLGYLAAHSGRHHPRERIADLLWPDMDMPAARTNLRQVLTPLAQALNRGDTPLLVTTKHTIGLFPCDYITIDVDAMTSLAETPPDPARAIPTQHEFERRLALVRGEFLAGITLPDCEEFEDWLRNTRRTLHTRASVFLERLCVKCEHAGQLAQAIRAAERLVALDAWHEPHHRLLMRLLARSGEPRAALAVFDHLAENLQRQLDTEPDAQTRRVHAEILAQIHARDADAADTMPGAGEERRWVTVLSCEVHARLDDPTRAATQCGQVLAQAAEHLRAAGGQPMPPMGRNLIAYFGWPRAQDDAARRAALAALHIQRLSAPGVSVRLGIHADVTQVLTVAGVPQLIGDVAETAMRLRTLIEDGQIAISQAALDRIDGPCQDDPLGVRQPSGVATPLAVHRLIAVAAAPPDSEPAHTTPLLGRDAELATLTDLWRDACAGNTRVALLIGEAGIGKTRLMHDLAARVGSEGHSVHVLAAQPESAARPLAPFAEWLKRIVGIGSDDTPAQRTRHLRDYLDGICDGADAETLHARLSTLIGGEEADGDDDSRQCWSEALIELFGQLSAQRPPLICCEDAQWADTSTLALLSRLCAGSGMVLVTVRPEGIAPGLPPDVVPIVLRPLDAPAARTLVGACAIDMPETRRSELLRHGGGHPLFLQELGKAAQRADMTATLPPTLFDAIQAQLDRIGTLKPLLQTAAVFGQRFRASLLTRVLASHDLSIELEQACRADLIVARADDLYQFRHAQIRDVAYLTLPRSRRRALHTSIHKLLAESATTPIEKRAYHLENAGEYVTAAHEWEAAGLLALRRRFAAEAVVHLERAIKLHALGQNALHGDHPLHEHLADAQQLVRHHALYAAHVQPRHARAGVEGARQRQTPAD